MLKVQGIKGALLRLIILIAEVRVAAKNLKQAESSMCTKIEHTLKFHILKFHNMLLPS